MTKCETCTHRRTNEDLNDYCELGVYPQFVPTATEDQESARLKALEIKECTDYKPNN